MLELQLSQKGFRELENIGIHSHRDVWKREPLFISTDKVKIYDCDKSNDEKLQKLNFSPSTRFDFSGFTLEMPL